MILFAFYASKNILMQFSMEAVENIVSEDSKTIAEIFSNQGIQQIAKVEVSANKITINFSEPVLFDPGSADLKETCMSHLRRLAQVFIELPNSVQIEGHTDNRPIGKKLKFASNWELSAARSFSVLRFLILEGVHPEKLSAVGYGEFKPVKTNDTIEGRAANRRIEINIIRHEI
jgi:chemotaxis protein MotB